MTLLEYRDKCISASISNPFLDKANLQLLDPDLFTDVICGMIEMIIAYTREDLELADSDTSEISLSQLHQIVIRRTNTAYYLHAEEWDLKWKSVSAMLAIDSDDLGSNWSRSNQEDGWDHGGTNTDGSAKRNSYNTSELVPVSGSHVEGSTDSSFEHHLSESGVQGASREQNIAMFLKNLDFKDLLDDIATQMTAAIAITVY